MTSMIRPVQRKLRMAPKSKCLVPIQPKTVCDELEASVAIMNSTAAVQPPHRGHAAYTARRFCNSVDIAMSNDPEKTIMHSISYSMLQRYCGPGYIDQLVVRGLDGINKLIIPSSQCEPEGIKSVIDWMQLDRKYTFSYIFLRQYFGGIDFLTICYADRAFLVLNMHFHSIEIREILGSRLSPLDATQTVWELRRVYNHLPRHSYHVELVIDCVEAKVKAYYRNMRRRRNADHRFDLEPILGCHETDKFLRQVFGRYLCNRGPHLYTRFSIFQDVDTGTRIKQWVLDVEDTDAYPVGQFPDPQRPFAPVHRNQSACRSNQKNRPQCHLKAYGSESRDLRSQTCSARYKC